MITNNGKALCFCQDYNFYQYYDYIQERNRQEADCNVKYTLQRTNGIAADIYKYGNGKMNYNYLARNLEIVVGSDDTPAQVTDYQLGNEIISTDLKVTYTNSQNAMNPERDSTNPLILHSTKTFYNASLINNITIKEIGLITKDGYGYSYLLLREVLENPIILAPDNTISLTITVN